jgi:hypothetical protein
MSDWLIIKQGRQNVNVKNSLAGLIMGDLRNFYYKELGAVRDPSPYRAFLTSARWLPRNSGRARL